MKNFCRSCNAEIRWSVTEGKGRRMPLDFEPVPNGNIELREREHMDPIAVYVTAQPDVMRFRSHFASCPQRAKWRKQP